MMILNTYMSFLVESIWTIYTGNRIASSSLVFVMVFKSFGTFLVWNAVVVLVMEKANREEMWIQLIRDCTKYVLYGICSNCSQKYPVLIDFYAFQKNANPKMDCDKCNGKDTLQVYATIP